MLGSFGFLTIGLTHGLKNYKVFSSPTSPTSTPTLPHPSPSPSQTPSPSLTFVANDPDEDGIPTEQEDANFNGNPDDDDTDGDGIPDYRESKLRDSDEDGIPDQLDPEPPIEPPLNCLSKNTTEVISLAASHRAVIKTIPSYEGSHLNVTVAGVVQATGSHYSDAFYAFANSKGYPIPFLDWIVSPSLWINNQAAANFIPDGQIPPPAKNHIYTFPLVLTATKTLSFTIGELVEKASDFVIQENNKAGRFMILVCPQIPPTATPTPPTPTPTSTATATLASLTPTVRLLPMQGPTSSPFPESTTTMVATENPSTPEAVSPSANSATDPSNTPSRDSSDSSTLTVQPLETEIPISPFTPTDNPTPTWNSSPTATPTAIGLWDGDQQPFGQNSVPQRWVNLLGKLSMPRKIRLIYRIINPKRDLAIPLSCGPNSAWSSQVVIV